MTIVYSFYLNSWKMEPFLQNPTIGPAIKVLCDLGAQETSLIVDHGDWWRLITPMFLHAGVLHYAFNMCSMWRVGGDLESLFGTFKCATIFLLSGVYAAVASAVFLPSTVCVGASGAIFGQFGAMAAIFIQNYSRDEMGVTKRDKFCNGFSLFFSILLNLGLGVVIPLLNNFAHIGGFVAGLLLGLMMCIAPHKNGVERGSQAFLMYGSAVLMFILGLAGMYMLYNDVDPHGWCSWCKYMSCAVDIGPYKCDQVGLSVGPCVYNATKESTKVPGETLYSLYCVELDGKTPLPNTPVVWMAGVDEETFPTAWTEICGKINCKGMSCS
jgi:membrane associated rhomboid family serine protease